MSATSPVEMHGKLREHVTSSVVEALRQLLGSKHLYQSVRVSATLSTILKLSAEVTPRQAQHGLIRRAQGLLDDAWLCLQPNHAGALPIQPPLWFEPPPVRLFCAVCDRSEPFNPVSAEDYYATHHGERHRHYFLQGGDRVQLFAFAYECQGCLGVPEVFLVRRDGLKLMLCGRSPIEYVPVSNVIPKSVRSYFSGAHHAHNSGQTLAGNFLLRTTVEQWVRLFPAASDRADDALKVYAATLPKDFKDRFPSLTELYEQLSDDIHRASGSIAVFEKASAAIVKHFDARRVYELEGPPTAPEEPAATT